MADDRDQLRRALRALFGPRRPGGAAPRERLEELVAAARSRDYFEVLGVSRSCNGVEVWQAADALLALLDRAEAEDPPLEGLADARLVVLDARDVLGDEGLRDAYRQGLGSG